MGRIREVIVVEGKYDAIRLHSAVEATVVETSGFGIFKDEAQLSLLRRLARERGLIILTDSDGAGFVIRNYLSGAIPSEQIKHAYIPEVLGKERRKEISSKEGLLGVEGIDNAVIIEALRRAGATFETGEAMPVNGCGLTKSDLFELGLVGGADSAQKRRLLQKVLGLPEKLSANRLLEILNAAVLPTELEGALAAISASAN